MDFYIRPIEEKDLPLVEQTFSNLRAGIHKKRFEDQQRGTLLYLITWDSQKVIARAMLKWMGAGDSRIPNPADCPDIESVFVVDEYRGHGIATKIILYCEDLAREKGFAKIGLSVGQENPHAHRLYTRLGYKNAGYEAFTIGDSYTDGTGKPQSWQETCTYLIKDL